MNLLSQQLQNKATREKHILIIEIESEIVSLGGRNYEDSLSVNAKFNIPGEGLDFVEISSSLVQVDGRDVIYHYMVYDLCHLDESSSI